MDLQRNAGRQGCRGHRRGRRHRPRHRADGWGARGQGRRQRRRRQPERRRRRTSGPAESVAAEIRAAGGEAVANPDSVAEPAGAQAHRRNRDRRLRPHRLRRQQCRHPARRILPQDDRRELGQRCSRCISTARSTSAAQPPTISRTAGRRRLRPHDLDFRADRQSGAGQLLGRQARHRRPVQVDRAGHAAVRRALQLHRALRLEPDDQFDQGGSAASRRRAWPSSSR